MNDRAFHLAQANFSRGRGLIGSSVMAPFVALLEQINSLADRSPGFVWRLQTADGDATAIRVFDDPLIIFNMSVWETIESLHEYVYSSAHVVPLRKRRDWFEKIETPASVLWWIPAGHTPTVEEAVERFGFLTTAGPTAEAFTFAKPFPSPADVSGAQLRPLAGCGS